MRILFVCDTYYPHINGVYYFVCRIAPLLRQNGHQVAVIAPSASVAYSERKIDGIDVYGVPSVPVFYYPNFRVPLPFLLRARIRRIQAIFQPDIIHVQDHFLIAKTIVQLNKDSGIPVVGTNHFMPENITALVRSEKWKRRLEKYCWSSFAAVFNQLKFVTTPTETAAELIRPRLTKKVMAISSGIDLKQYRPSGNEKAIRKKYGIPDKPVLLYVGRLDPEKHIHEILQAFAIAVIKIDGCCVITGKGLERSALGQLSIKLGIQDNVIFTGFVAEEDLPVLYQLSRCFIIASTAELLSLATLQAMACRLPVIAVNAGALPELVQDDVNGYLFNEGDIETMSDSISRIFTNDDLFRSMGDRSLEFAMKHDISITLQSFV
jgi:glycosyltransferase involved in cell wall biosynthesis